MTFIAILREAFETFSFFTGLTPNTKKSEIACIGGLKIVQVIASGITYIDLHKNGETKL